jgi:hypothetical protein
MIGNQPDRQASIYSTQELARMIKAVQGMKRRVAA